MAGRKTPRAARRSFNGAHGFARVLQIIISVLLWCDEFLIVTLRVSDCCFAELKTQALKYDKTYEKHLQSMVPTFRVVPSGSGEDPKTVSIAGFVVDARAKRKTFVPMNIEMQFIEKHKIMCPGPGGGCIVIHQFPHFSFHSVAGISCSWSWTRSFVLYGQVLWVRLSLWDADMTPHQRKGSGRTAWCQSRRIIDSVFHSLLLD